MRSTSFFLISTSIITIATGQATLDLDDLSPQQSRIVESAAAPYISSIIGDPQFTSLGLEIATALPPSVITSIAADGGADLAEDIREGETPDWYTYLPQDAETYINSIAAAVTSIANEALDITQAPSPTATGVDTEAPSQTSSDDDSDDDSDDSTSTQPTEGPTNTQESAGAQTGTSTNGANVARATRGMMLPAMAVMAGGVGAAAVFL